MKQKQHLRRYRTGKRTLVNKGIVKVSKYKREVKGKKYDISGYQRHKRKMGKKITYHEVGKFYLGHDEYGNIRGSRVVPTKSRARAGAAPEELDVKKIDELYSRDKIKFEEWRQMRKRAIDLS